MCYTPDWTFSDGAELKKTAPVNAQSENNNNYSRDGRPNNRNSSASYQSPPSVTTKRGSGGGGMMEELSNRFGTLKSVSAAEKTPPANNQRFTSPSQLPKGDNTAAAKTTATNRYSPPTPSPIVQNGKSNSAAARSDSERLDAIEKKLDKIMEHLCIS